MLTISETVTPKFSYNNILKHPLTKKLFKKIISQVGIKEDAKKKLLGEFSQIINNFEDFEYTGDIEHFKVNLYTSLSETGENISLFDLLSTKEFVIQSSEAIKDLIYISLTENKETVSLERYIDIVKQRGERNPNILTILRGVYSFDDDRQIHRDTTELLAALKKHLIINNSDNSSKALSSLVEKLKQDEANKKENLKQKEDILVPLKNIIEHELSAYKKKL